MGSKLQLKVTDLGFVAWKGNSRRIDNNSTITYDGIEVENVFDLDGVVLDQAELQDTIGLNYEQGGFAQLLPTLVEARLRIGWRLSRHCSRIPLPLGDQPSTNGTCRITPALSVGSPSWRNGITP
ncbi:MAG: hypothetical protein IPI55_12005 [Flavobacteriales bacterium]|nr:hypothetical protein [Flavobacteriales bacterium]